MSQEREVQQVLAKYTRASDARDVAVMRTLFAPDATFEVFFRNGTSLDPLGKLVGVDAIADAIPKLLKPHAARGRSHHMTYDPIVEVDGDSATFDGQFLLFEVLGKAQPAEGWPPGAYGPQGTITPTEAGYYQTKLRKLDGTWKISEHRILLDLPTFKSVKDTP